MFLPLKFALRYLFSKKSHNAINVISMISLCGVAVITAALVCTMSVFNGFPSLIEGLYTNFDPQLRIEPAKGKTFNVNDSLVAQIRQWPQVKVFSEALEENGLLRYKERQIPATIRGVSDNFKDLASVDSIMLSGHFIMNDGVVDYANMGVGLASQLGVNAGFIQPVSVYVPRRYGKVNLANPSSAFNEGRLFVGSVFSVSQADYDDRLLIAPIEFARDMFGSEGEVSYIDLRLQEDANVKKIQSRIQNFLGSGFKVINQMQLHAESYRIMQVEKWMTFLMFVLILLIACFNIVGSLSMLIIDKRQDIETLRNLGADDSLIRRIFIMEGWLITEVGAVAGILLGSVLCWVQQTFGLLTLGDVAGTFIVDAYPVKLIPIDIISIFFIVSLLGFLAAIYPARTLSR